MNLTMADLKSCFQSAVEMNAKFMGVKISVPNCPENEVIINPTVNFEAKLTYYMGAYNADLTLKTFKMINITGFAYGNNYRTLEEALK